MHYINSLPGCYSNGDRNVGGDGGVWPSFMNDRTLTGGISYNGLLTPPSEDQFSGYKKEVIRQTMLKHEAIFRDQVRELHRLYKRQRELMDEIKRREISKQNSQILAWQHASLPWVNPSTGALSVSSTVTNLQASSSFPEWQNMQATPRTAQALGNFKSHESSCSTVGKPKRKMLDLELPAAEYIDSEEESRFIKRNVYEVPMVVPFHPPNGTPVFSNRRELTLFPCSNPVNSICQSGSSNPDRLARSVNRLADLNEPIGIEDEVASNGTSSGAIHVSEDIVRACLKTTHVDGRQPKLLPCIDEAGQSIGSSSCLPQHSPKSPSNKRAKSSEASPSRCGNILYCGKGMDLNMPPSYLPDSESPDRGVGTEDGAKSLEDTHEMPLEPRETDNERDLSTEIISVEAVTDSNLPGSKNLIDLNSSVNEHDTPSAIKAVTDTDLEAPISPENKECSPPRGESEENFLETDEKDLVAAEAIVVMSTSAPAPNMSLKPSLPETPEALVSDSLLWFAEMVSSVADNLKVGSELSSEEGSGYLGAERKARAGNGRRGGRLQKDIHTRLLPSLSSLSGHEASDDLQTIGGLVKASDFNMEKYLGKRNASRSLKAKKRRGNVNNEHELGSLERSLKGWGKINRRRRGPRVRANKFPRIIS